MSQVCEENTDKMKIVQWEIMHRREVIKIVSTKIIQSYVKKLLNKIQNRTQKII